MNFRESAGMRKYSEMSPAINELSCRVINFFFLVHSSSMDRRSRSRKEKGKEMLPGMCFVCELNKPITSSHRSCWGLAGSMDDTDDLTLRSQYFLHAR